MRRHHDRVRLRHDGNVHQRRDAADRADVRVEDVGGARREAPGELFLRIKRLAGDDRDRHRTPHLGQEGDVVGKARLLVPVDVELGQPAADADRVLRRKAAMRLDQDLEIRPHRLRIART